MSDSRRHLMKKTRAELVSMLEEWRASALRARQAERGEARAWWHAQRYFYWADAELRGIRLTMQTITIKLGGQPDNPEHVNLIWILKRIEELRARCGA